MTEIENSAFWREVFERELVDDDGSFAARDERERRNSSNAHQIAESIKFIRDHHAKPEDALLWAVSLARKCIAAAKVGTRFEFVDKPDLVTGESKRGKLEVPLRKDPFEPGPSGRVEYARAVSGRWQGTYVRDNGDPFRGGGGGSGTFNDNPFDFEEAIRRAFEKLKAEQERQQARERARRDQQSGRAQRGPTPVHPWNTWWGILLELPDTVSLTERDIEHAFRMKSKTEHPDVGGTHERFTRLQQARLEARRRIGIIETKVKLT